MTFTYEVRQVGNQQWVYYTFSKTFSIVASPVSVHFAGLSGKPEFTTQEDLDEFYKVMQWAYRHHQSLKATGKPLDQDQLTQECLN